MLVALLKVRHLICVASLHLPPSVNDQCGSEPLLTLLITCVLRVVLEATQSFHSRF